jgi:hypothetical protein
MVATLTTSLKNPGARDPESTLEATATAAQLAISKEKKGQTNSHEFQVSREHIVERKNSQKIPNTSVHT